MKNTVQLYCKSGFLTSTFELGTSWDVQTKNKISVIVSFWYTLLLNTLESSIKLFQTSHKVVKTKLINSKLH